MSGAWFQRVVYLAVDCSEAGDADVRAEVMYKGILIPARVLPEDNKAYRIFFSPEGTGTYQIRIFYNGQEIPGNLVWMRDQMQFGHVYHYVSIYCYFFAI